MTKDSSALFTARKLFHIKQNIAMFDSMHNTIFLAQHRTILRLLVCGGQPLHRMVEIKDFFHG